MHYQPDWDEVEYAFMRREEEEQRKQDAALEAAWYAHELELQQEEGK